MRRDAEVATIAVGLITTALQAEAVLADGRADLIAIGRQAQFEPNWPLHAALELLSDRDRQLLELRYTEDLTQQAIARRLGIPEGTVKVRLHRARDKLRRAYVLQ